MPLVRLSNWWLSTIVHCSWTSSSDTACTMPGASWQDSTRTPCCASAGRVMTPHLPGSGSDYTSGMNGMRAPPAPPIPRMTPPDQQRGHSVRDNRRGSRVRGATTGAQVNPTAAAHGSVEPGTVVLVTGGAQGVGAALSRHLAAEWGAVGAADLV